MKEQYNILDPVLFRSVREKDLESLDARTSAMFTTWTAGMEHRGVGQAFERPEEVLKYIDCWDIWETFPKYADPRPELVEASWSVTRHIYQSLCLPIGHRFHENKPLPVDYINAEDFYFQTLGGLNSPKDKMCLLDFGAGMGRQINIWSQYVNELSWIAVDAIEMAYMVQRFNFTCVPELDLVDYIDQPDKFSIDTNPAIWHLPTWAIKHIPANSVDMILAVQVLPELKEELIHYLLARFTEVLRPGGAIFIRDHGLKYIHEHKVDFDAELESLGFHCEYAAFAEDGVELHGIPRIWRKPIQSSAPAST